MLEADLTAIKLHHATTLLIEFSGFALSSIEISQHVCNVALLFRVWALLRTESILRSPSSFCAMATCFEMKHMFVWLCLIVRI